MKSIIASAWMCSSFLIGALAGCEKTPELKPPNIHFGQDTCHACGMIVQDERYASAVVIVNADGELQTFLFDDPGEMLAFSPPAAVTRAAWYVRDAGTKQWLDAAGARYVQSDKLQTPMGSGIAAHGTEPAAAEAAAPLEAKVRSFEQLRGTTRESGATQEGGATQEAAQRNSAAQRRRRVKRRRPAQHGSAVQQRGGNERSPSG